MKPYADASYRKWHTSSCTAGETGPAAAPRPTWTRKKTSQMCAPACATRAATPGRSSTLPVHHGGIDLHGDARVGEPGDGRDRLLEVPGDTADAVVSLRAAAVQADRDGPDAAAGDPVDHGRVEQRRDRRRQAYRHAQRDGVIDQAEHVRPEQAVTAGEHEDRVGPPEAGHLLDQRVALRRAQLPRRRLRGRAGPAVPAGQQAGPGRLPEHEHRTLVEVDSGPRTHRAGQ